MAADIKSIDIKICTCYFFNDMINLKNFDSNLLKIDKNRTKALIFITLDTSQFKKLMTMKIFTV